jgi:site-specific recombinase XerD
VHEPFNEAVKRAGLQDWITPHTLRHSYGFRAMERTGRVDIVQQLLELDNIESARVYLADVSSNGFLESVSAWD